MQLIANGTQGATTLPTKQTPIGTPGYANSGTPGVFTPTNADPDIFNTVLAELIAVVLASGQTLDPTNNAQLLAAFPNVIAASFTGSAHSLVTNGYQKLPGGLILQWATVTAFAQATTTFSFPIAFPTAALMATGNIGVAIGLTSNGIGIGVQIVSRTQFAISIATTVTAGTSEGCIVFAVGY